MLDLWIIEEIRRKEREMEDNRPVLQLPMHDDYPPQAQQEESKSTVIIIKIGEDSEEEE